MIYGAVKGQLLKVKATAVADTIDYLTANFTFLTSEWNGLVVYAHFAKGNERHSVELVDGKIGEEDHLNLSAGEWSVYLHGNEYSHGEVKKRVTTDIAKFTVQPTGVLDGEPFPEVEASIVEEMLAELADHEERIADLEEGGGGGGTTDYERLENKPSINGVTLIGDKDAEDLGLVNAVQGKGLSTNDYTTAEKTKLAGIESGAEVNEIESIQTADGTAILPVNKTVTLPRATATEIFGTTALAYEASEIVDMWEDGTPLLLMGNEVVTTIEDEVILHISARTISNGVIVYKLFAFNKTTGESAGDGTPYAYALTEAERAKLYNGQIVSGNGSFVTGAQVFDYAQGLLPTGTAQNNLLVWNTTQDTWVAGSITDVISNGDSVSY